MSWQQYVDDGLVETGKIYSGAIIGLKDCSIWAKSSKFPSMTAAQFKAIQEGFTNPMDLRSNGIRVAKDKYIALKMDDRSIYGKMGSNGIMAVKTKQAIIVAFYTEGMIAGDASKVAEGLADYLISAGF